MIRHFLNPPNWFTSASIFCSVYALSLVIGTEVTPELLSRACLLIVFGGVFDLLDGRVARMTNRYSEFGVQLDSIADIVSFGVAPALLVYAWKLHEFGFPGVLIAFWFALAAAFRLARFNVNTTLGEWSLKGHSQGLTSTMAGGTLVTFIWVSNGWLASRFTPGPVLVSVVVALLGLLMVSSAPFRTFRDIRVNRTARGLLALSLSACLAGALVLHPSMWFGVGAFLYITVGLVDSAIVWAHFRQAGSPLPGDREEAELAALDEQLEPAEADI